MSHSWVVSVVLQCVVVGTALAQQPADYESLLASAQQSQARGDFESAANFYRRASILRPEVAELKANLGLMYYQAKKDGEAAEAFQQAIRINPELFVPNLFLGLDYLRMKRFSEAVPYLKHAARLKPADFHVEIGMGEAYSGAGNTRLAIQSYGRAIESEPENADAWYRLGMVYLQLVEANARILVTRYKESGYTQALVAENFAEQHAFNEAAVSYQKALSLPTFPPGTHAGYGFVLLNHRNQADAEREFRLEFAADPGSLLAKLGMARLALEQGAIERGAQLITEVSKADSRFLPLNVGRLTESSPADGVVWGAVLEKLTATGELSEEVVSLLRSGVSGTPHDSRRPSVSPAVPALGASDAKKLYGRGAYAECSDVLASRQQSLSTSDLRLFALCAFAAGDYERASEAAGRMSGSAPMGGEGLYWETKSSEKLAGEAFAHASMLDSSSPQLHVLLGDIYRQQQHLSDAEQEYRKGLTLRPGDPGALFGLCLTLLADSRKGEALQVAGAALKDNPDDPELNAVMGEILCDRDDFAEAEAYLKKSLHTKPEYVSHVHALLGKVYANTNRPDDAIRELKLALPEDRDGSLNYQLGRLYLKRGDRTLAQASFEASKRLEEQGLRKPLKDLRPEHADVSLQ